MSDTPPPMKRTPTDWLFEARNAAHETGGAPSEDISTARNALWKAGVAVVEGWHRYDMLRGSLAEALGVVDDPTRPWTWLVEEVHALRQRAAQHPGGEP